MKLSESSLLKNMDHMQNMVQESVVSSYSSLNVMHSFPVPMNQLYYIIGVDFTNHVEKEWFNPIE